MTTWFESGSEPALVPGSVFSASVLDLSSALLFPSSLSSAEQNRDMLVSDVGNAACGKLMDQLSV